MPLRLFAYSNVKAFAIRFSVKIRKAAAFAYHSPYAIGRPMAKPMHSPVANA